MRFRLILEVNKHAFGSIIPINYQYEQSAVIYRILSSASEEYAAWLHDNGYKIESGKRFKLFCYSRFKIEQRKIITSIEGIKILSDTIEWQISFLLEKSTEKFIQGVFANQVFEIGDIRNVVQFRVRGIEVLPEPEYREDMLFSTMSPICLRVKKEDGGTEYMSPADERALPAIRSGLLSKYEAINGSKYNDDSEIRFTLISEPKPVLVKLKAWTPEETKVKGYMCQFAIRASEVLMKIMYESGIGEECSQGFGCVQLLKK